MERKIKSETLRKRLRRVKAVRKKVAGSPARPRLAVYRSARHIYAQIIDDEAGKTLAAASSRSKGFSADGDKKAKAEEVGKKLAEVAKAAGIETVVFDRHGWPFHGRIAALAKGAREGGLSF